MPRFTLKSLDGPDQELSMCVGNDGDVHITVWDYDERFHQMIPHNVRIGIGPNTGDPNDDVKDIQVIKKLLRALAIEFKYHNGEISEDDIETLRIYNI